ncbi:MAG TPA: hypothetical protein ENF52_05075 [Chloroflexi bacterium]|nr:hypothetical protein [Chloroflexota bacterium]
MIEFISIVVLTFALALIVLGIVTVWLERGPGRLNGIVLIGVGLLIGVGYAFLGSRFSLDLFDRLIVRVDLPKLMGRAFTYTAGVLAGVGMAAGSFLWVTGRFRRQTEQTAVAFIVVGLFIAMIATVFAVALSRP